MQPPNFLYKQIYQSLHNLDIFEYIKNLHNLNKLIFLLNLKRFH